MKIVNGNLVTLALDGKFDVIIHGCNCFNTMGAGIAKEIKSKFPEAYQIDCKTIKGDMSKLGNITYADIKRPNKYKINIKISEKKEINVGEGYNQLSIVNGYTQFSYYGKKCLVDYDAVRKVFKKVKKLFADKRIGYPKIGAGLAGGDWSIIEKIINEELEDEDHTLVLFN